MNYHSSDTQIIEHTIKLSNGIPVSILFVLLFVLGWYIEDTLSKIEQVGVSVRLAPKTTESDETDSVAISLLQTDKVKSLSLALYQLMVDGGVSVVDYESSEILDNLESIEKDSVIVLSLKQLVKRKQYELSYQYLLEYSLEQRLSLGIQFSKAFTETKLKKLDEAIKSYQLLLDYQPNNQAAIINLGYLLLGQHEYIQAEQLFANSIDIASGKRKSKVLSGLANALASQKRFAEAIPHFQKSIEYRPSHPLTWRSLAETAALDFSNHHLISDSYNKAIALDKNNLELYLGFSHYLIRKLDYKMAIVQLKKARKLSRENFSIRFLLAFCYNQINKSVNARKQLLLASKFVKRSSDKLQLEAMQSYLSGEYRLSLNLFKGLLKKGRQNSLEYFLIAKTFSQLNKPKNAKIYLDKIQQSSSYYYLGQQLLAENQFKSNSLNESSKLYTQLSLAITDNPALYYQAGIAAEKANNIAQAKQSVEQALKYSDSRKMRLKLAEIEWLLGNQDQAIALLRALVSSEPNYSKALFFLANYLTETKEEIDAVAHYEQLLSLRSSYSDAEYRLALIYFARADYQNSLPRVISYLENRPNSKKARFLLARAFCEIGQVKECVTQLELVLSLDNKYKPVLDYISDQNLDWDK